MMMLGDDRHQLSYILSMSQTFDAAIAVAEKTAFTTREHWRTFQGLGVAVDSILEFGTGFSTLAWLSVCQHVTSVDVEPLPWIERLCELTNLAGNPLKFVCSSDLEFPVQPADLLYIDTFHTYEHLSAELARHGNSARQLIVLHDTEAFGKPDSLLTLKFHAGGRGLWLAVEEFCTRENWRVAKHFSDLLGLTVLKRK